MKAKGMRQEDNGEASRPYSISKGHQKLKERKLNNNTKRLEITTKNLTSFCI